MRFARLLLAFAAFVLFSTLGRAQHFAVPMSDGTSLEADVFLPAEGDGPFPVILARSPYGLAPGPAIGGSFTSKGVAFMIQNTRGRFVDDVQDRVFEDDGWMTHKDGLDTVNWIREQSWCNGAVGTWGYSALGITENLMAVPVTGLKCQVLGVAASNFYGQCTYQGGVYRKSLFEKWLAAQGSLHMVETYAEHPTYDDYWAYFNVEAQADKIDAPAIHMGGWFDIFQQGTINSFTSRQYQGGEGARGKQMLIIGPWPHGPLQKVGDLTFPDNFNFDLNGDEKRFLLHYLVGEENGILDEPPVKYYTMGDTTDPDAPGNVWNTATAWPPVPTAPVSYYLRADASLSTTPSPDGDGGMTYTFDPANPCPTKGGPNLLIPAGPFDQQDLAARDDVLFFQTPALEAPVEVTGSITVRLYVSTNAKDTDFTAKFLDIYPDGKQILMNDGIRRLRFHKGFETESFVPVGEIVALDIDLWSTSLILNTGHRIGVQISSSNYPRFELNPNNGDNLPTADNLTTARNTIHMNAAHPSAIILPVRQ